MGIDLDFEVKEGKDLIYVNVTGADTGTIIGKRGQTLDAVQYLASLVVNKENGGYTRVVMDAENYRAKREQTLVSLANRLAGKVERSERKITLEPMNPYERKVIHSTLQNHPSVTTRSEGKDPYRRVIIEKNNTEMPIYDGLFSSIGEFMADTIAAIATPLGEGGVGIVRVSGPNSLSIMKSIYRECPDEVIPRHVYYGHAVDNKGTVIDDMVSIYMKAPHTFTGDDVVEFQAHGSKCISKAYPKKCIAYGARLADPGEFTKKRFS